jgi:hypothetical protein
MNEKASAGEKAIKDLRRDSEKGRRIRRVAEISGFLTALIHGIPAAL